MKKVSSIFLVSWILAGMAGFSIAGFLYNPNAPEQIKQNIISAFRNKESTRLMDALPGLFDSNPSLGAVFILSADENYTIYASLYEKNRISDEQYRSLVNNFRESIVRLQKEKSFQIFRFNMEEKSVYLFFARNGGFYVSYFINPSRYPYFTLVFILYILVFFFSILWAIYDMSEHTAERRKFADRKPPQPATSFPPSGFSEKTPPRKPGKEMEWDTSRYLMENKLKDLLEAVEQTFMAKKIIYYSGENGRWKGILEKRDTLYVKGESIRLPSIPFSSGFSDPVVKAQTREIFFPVIRNRGLDGMLYFQYPETYHFSMEDLKILTSLVSRFSESLFIQKTYEKAVFNETSGFFTFPYLYFLLQEKLINSSSFEVLHFTVPGDSQQETDPRLGVLAELLKKFVQGFLAIAYEDPKVLPIKIFQVDIHQFYLVLDREFYPRLKRNLTDKDIKKIILEIREILQSVYHTFIPAALVSGSAGEKDVHAFLKKVRLEWELARDGKIFGKIKKENIKPVYETPA